MDPFGWWFGPIVTTTRGGSSWFHPFTLFTTVKPILDIDQEDEDPDEELSEVNKSDSSADSDSESSMGDKDNAGKVSKLTRDNYGRWRIEIKDVLRGKALWAFADGTKLKPTAPEAGANAAAIKEYEDWETSDSKARAIIRRTLDDTTFNHVQDCETSKEIVDRIRELREPKTTDVLMTSLTEFFSVSWKSSDDVTSFMASLNVLATRINAIEAKMVTDKYMIAKILSSLPSKFDTFVQSWNLIGKDSPTLSEFREKLVSAERGLSKETVADINDVDALKAQVSGKGRTYVPRRANKTDQCGYCKKYGHFVKDCWKKKRNVQGNGSNSRQEPDNSTRKETGSSGDSFQAAMTVISDRVKIIADSGASRHLTSQLSWFVSLRKLENPIKFSVAGPDQLIATHVGDVDVEVSSDGKKWHRSKWTDVHYSAQLGETSLLSTTYLGDKGLVFSHRKESMMFLRNGKPYIGGHREGNSFKPFIRVLTPTHRAMAAHSINVWHQRLGHIPHSLIRTMESKGVVEDMSVLASKRELCDACHFGKQTANVHKSRNETRDCRPGERFHSDVCQVNIKSWNGHCYFLTIKDEASAYRTVFFLRTKDEVADCIKKFFTQSERITGRKPVSIRTDNGTEYVNSRIEKMLSDLGVTHERSPAYVKQANGMAERENRTLCDTARSLLFNADLSKEERSLVWDEAVATAAYLRNRVPNRGTSDMTPYELFFGKKPSVGHLRVFGAPAFVKIPEGNRKKMDAKSRKCIFVGYDRQTDKVVRVFDREKKIVERVSDVIIEDSNDDNSVLFPFEDESETEVECQSPEEDNEEEDDVEIAPTQIKRGRPPGTKTRKEFDPHPMSTRSKADLIAMRAEALDPITVDDALSRADSHEWRKAMDAEMDSLKKNETWKVVPLPVGRKAVTCRWVFKSKLNPDGSLAKRKARLVARGFSQTHGVDYFETFSPVVRYESVRCVLSMAAAMDMEIAQFDVQTAFLNGPLAEEIYMCQPEGYEDGSENVCRLYRSLYGLKQAPRCWNGKFNEFLEQHGFTATDQDRCVYTRKVESKITDVLCLYVDDGLVCSTSKSSLSEFLSILKSTFDVTINEPNIYVGMQIERNRSERTITVTQSGYIQRVLERFGMHDSKAASSPIDPTIKLARGGEDERFECPYREIIGCLNYASIIARPDITYAVNVLARFSNCPNHEHWNAAKRVLRYLRGTIKTGITLGGDQTMEVNGFCDSDWGSEPDQNRSTSGFIFTINRGPVAWSSSLQRLSALSVSEAEYVSLAEALQEVLWLRPFLSSLGFEMSQPTPINVDNQAAIALSKNPEYHKRTKHIGIRYHRIRQEQENGVVIVEYVPTEMNAADFLTKSLSGVELKRKLSLLNVQCRG